MNFKCFLCINTFNSLNNFFLHLKEHAIPKDIVYKCTYENCFQNFSVKDSFKTHVSRHFRNAEKESKIVPERHYEQCPATDTENNYISNSYNYQENMLSVYNSAAKFVAKLHSFNNLSRSDVNNIRYFVETLILNPVVQFIEQSQNPYNNSNKSLINVLKDVTEFYTNGKRGKIYNKLANYKRFSKNALKVDEPEVTQGLSESVEDYTLIIEVLRSSKIKQDEFDIYWQKCATLRFQQITNSENTCEIFKLWPEYTKPSGHLLIDIDFVLKYPVAKNFEERWPYFAEDLLFILKTRISCSLISKKLLQTERIDEDSKMFTILWYCHNLFPPQLKISTDENGAKYKKKFTIADSQESFAVVASTMDELETKLKLLKLQGRKIQPKLLVIGDTLKVKQIFVYFDNLRYPFVSTLKAFDVLFKIFFVFNLEYPSESEIFYHFIQSLFYDLPTSKKFIKSNIIKHEILKMKN